MFNTNIEQVVLKNILTNEPYMRKVLPFIRPDYFEGVYRQLFNIVGNYVGKYNKLPSLEALKIDIDDSDKLTDEQYSHALEILPNLFGDKTDTDNKWLEDTTEKWCKKRAIDNALIECVLIRDGKHKTLSENSMEGLLSKALAVSFDTNIGHDYIENAADRYDFYHEDVERIPFDLEYFNKITKGGLPNKTLNIALAGCVHPDTKIKVRMRKKL